MAEITLKNVINSIENNGEETRTTIKSSSDSLLNSLNNINSSFTKFFEVIKETMARQNVQNKLADKSGGFFARLFGRKESNTNEDVDKSEEPEKKKGFFAKLFGAVAGGFGLVSIAKALMGGIKTFLGLIFNPKNLLQLIGKLALRFSPLAIVSSIIAAISGGISSFFESEKTTFLAKLSEGFSGAIGQVIEFFTFGLIKKENVTELLKPLTDLFEDIGIWVLDMIDKPGEALDKAIAAMTRVGIWFSGVLGNIWESLGLDDLTKTLLGTKISGEKVTKFVTNLFSSKPEEGYFSIVKSVSDIWSSVKTWFETKYTNLTKLLNDSWISIVGEGSILDMIWSPFKSALEWLDKKFSGIELSTVWISIVGEGGILDMIWSPFKSALEWLDKKFGSIELSTVWTGIVGEGGILDMIWSPFKSALEWLDKKFSGIELSTVWNAIVGEGGILDMIWSPFKSALEWLDKKFGSIIDDLSKDFTKVTNWVSSIPNRILFAAEEMWINTKADLKKNFIAFVDYITSLPNQMLLMAQETVYEFLSKAGLVGRKLAETLGLNEESLKKDREKLKKSDNDLRMQMDTIDLQKSKELADLEARRKNAMIKENTESNNNKIPTSIINNSPVDGKVTNYYNSYYNNYYGGSTVVPGMPTPLPQ